MVLVRAPVPHHDQEHEDRGHEADLIGAGTPLQHRNHDADSRGEKEDRSFALVAKGELV